MEVEAARLEEMSDDQVVDAPLDQLAMSCLSFVERTQQWHANNFLGAAGRGRSAEAQKCLAESLHWMITYGVLSLRNPTKSNSESIFITRNGKEALREGKGPTVARARLAINVHNRLAKAKSQFLIGEFETAVFVALKEVEVRIRHLSGAANSLVGVALVREAFSPDKSGPLADPELDRAEQLGLMELFSGAIAVFKNPSSHRPVDFSNPTEASEVVLPADLLMRLLDRIESGIAS